MAANPLVNQGTLNRVRGSVELTDFPQLNVTASFLAKEAIRLRLDGEATQYIETMTGAVTSRQPYLMVIVEMHLLRTQPLANQYKTQWETSSVIGDMTVTPDTSALGVYPLINCSINSVGEQSFAGEDPAYVVTMRGYYLINSDLFNLN